MKIPRPGPLGRDRGQHAAVGRRASSQDFRQGQARGRRRTTFTDCSWNTAPYRRATSWPASSAGRPSNSLSEHIGVDRLAFVVGLPAAIFFAEGFGEPSAANSAAGRALRLSPGGQDRVVALDLAASNELAQLAGEEAEPLGRDACGSRATSSSLRDSSGSNFSSADGGGDQGAQVIRAARPRSSTCPGRVPLVGDLVLVGPGVPARRQGPVVLGRWGWAARGSSAGSTELAKTPWSE